MTICNRRRLASCGRILWPLYCLDQGCWEDELPMTTTIPATVPNIMMPVVEIPTSPGEDPDAPASFAASMSSGVLWQLDCAGKMPTTA